jgi:general secretion pathway protein B
MSYILEALKKVEQKREQEDASRPPTFSSEQAQERKKPLVWPYILAAALFVNAGLALRLFGPWWTHEQEPSSIPLSPSEPPPAAPARIEKEAQSRVPLAKIAVNEPAHSKGAKISQTLRARQKGESAAETPTVGQKGASETAPLPAAQKASPVPPEAPKQVQVRVEKAPSPAFAGKVVSPSELPPAIRGSLPEFKISGHAYGPDPQTRVVRVNEKILQEGQELSPGLRVEEIVPDGIILSYGGYRFHIGVNDSH